MLTQHLQITASLNPGENKRCTVTQSLSPGAAKKVSEKGEKTTSTGDFCSVFGPRSPPVLVLGGWTRPPIGVVVGLAWSRRPGVAVIISIVVVDEIEVYRRHSDNR